MTQNDPLNFYLIDLIYLFDKNSLKIILIGRSLGTLQRVYIIISDFFPYLYVESNSKNLTKIKQLLKNNEQFNSWMINKTNNFLEVEKFYYFRFLKKKVIKLTGDRPFKVPEIKRIIENMSLECFEYDIPFIHRYLIDNGIYCGSNYILPIENTESAAPLYISSETIILKNNILPTNKSPLLIASIDIETGNDESISFQELETRKEYKIIAIGICFGFYSDSSINYETKSFIISEDSNLAENRLLKEFLAFITNLDPDCIITFNGDNFDLPYLEHRLKLYNLSFTLSEILGVSQNVVKSEIDGRHRISGKTLIDLFPKTWNIHTKSGKKGLIDVAEYFFGQEKDKILKLNIPSLPGTLFKNNNIDLLKQYVEQDVKITFELFQKFSSDLALVKVNGAPYSDALLSTQRVNGEFLLMRILFEKNILIPSKPNKVSREINKQLRKDHPHTGGQVITPKKVTAENVIIADFLSMYPTLINSYNIGSETFISESEFTKEPRASLSLLQERVIKKRIEIKNLLKIEKNSESEGLAHHNQQKALKLVANSMYGATLYIQGRFFDIEVCNSITSMARSLMNKIFIIAKDYGDNNDAFVEVIYSDTDSVFIAIQSTATKNLTNNSELLKWLQNFQAQLLAHINKQVPNGMELTLEDIAKRILFQKMSEKEGGELRKKAYAYYSLVNQKLMIKGFEAIRTDLSPLTKKTQENLFYILLKEKNPEKKAVLYLKKVIKKIKEEDESNLLGQVLYSGIIKRKPSKYKSTTPAIGAFLHYCKVYNQNPEILFSEFPRFPYAITIGKRNDPLFKKARHPDIIINQQLRIDRTFYIEEILRIAERFELKNPIDYQTSLLDYL